MELEERDEIRSDDFAGKSEIELDLPPEYCRYRDEGCELAGSYKIYLEDVTVARNLPVAEMVQGRKVAVLFLDEHNAKEAVVIAVYI
jgi:hypothetical protein